MPLITLLTDFGTIDEYAGVMKGVILGVSPLATVIDITHNLRPHDVRHAAYMLEAVYRFFPRKTVHLAVVDPGVGSGRKILAMETDDYVFLAPDNGLLTLVMDQGGINCMVSVENPNYFLDSVSRTFHGRDVFAPVAAHIANGVDPSSLGPVIDPGNVVRLPLPQPEITFIEGRQTLIGAVTAADRFGNLTTNIDAATLARFMGTAQAEDMTVEINGRRIKGPSQSYASVDSGCPLMIVGSRNYLEIAVNQGQARHYFNIDLDGGQNMLVTISVAGS